MHIAGTVIVVVVDLDEGPRLSVSWDGGDSVIARVTQADGQPGPIVAHWPALTPYRALPTFRQQTLAELADPRRRRAILAAAYATWVAPNIDPAAV